MRRRKLIYIAVNVIGYGFNCLPGLLWFWCLKEWFTYTFMVQIAGTFYSLCFMVAAIIRMKKYVK